MKRPKPKKRMLRQEKWLLTNEDWYPTCEGGRVRASLLELFDGKFRVCVWGDDDHGLERDYETREEAERVFNELPLLITHAHLQDVLGFWRA